MTQGFSTQPAATLLSERALDLLARGPTDAVPLIEHVCQMAGAPRVVAEQMAIALFAHRPEFARDAEGRWCLSVTLPVAVPIAPDPASDAESRRAPARGARLCELSYVVVDLETTGSSPWSGDRITEVAAVVVRDGQLARTYETLINPERSIPPFITRLTNISWDMVKDKPTFRDICDELLGVLEGHVFVAHNAPFDWGFLSAEVERTKGRKMGGHRLCTVRLARRILPQLRSRRLDSVAEHYGVEIGARHRAAGDAEATAKVLLRLLDDARGRDCDCWDDLQRLLGARTPSRKRGRRPPAMPRPVDKDTTA